MAFSTILYQLLIAPLHLFFEVIFALSYHFTKGVEISILILSVTMNLLVLPLYKRADEVQARERELERKMAPVISHIKKTFHGDERFMLLQTCYRQHSYKPVHSLNGSLSLLLEIPFFIAAYHFLSNLPLLQEETCGPIADLGRPDALLQIGTVTVNLLPVLMTAINMLSGYIYSRGFSAKEKIQLYSMALIFLVFLYQSPAGLVIYWTLNNIFSLGKNIIMGMKSKKTVRQTGETVQKHADSSRMFLMGALAMTLIPGLLIPSSILGASPQEFVMLRHYTSPLVYLEGAFLTAAGFFLVWGSFFYYLAEPRIRCAFEKVLWTGTVLCLINYLFFGAGHGAMSSEFRYDRAFTVDKRLLLFNTLLLIAAGVFLWILHDRRRRLVRFVVLTMILAMTGISAVNVQTIRKSLFQMKSSIDAHRKRPRITLSRTGKNVIVLMLDRGLSVFMPYIFEEKPELKEKFSGFTVYGNTLSYGMYTNFGSPALYGGYEYTPENLNRRENELLVDKQNEALKVMPHIFGEHDFKVTICDPTYAGYGWIPDVSIYDDYPQFDIYITNSYFIGEEDPSFRSRDHIWRRNLFCHSFMKASPLFLQPLLYNNSSYLDMEAPSEENEWQEVKNCSAAKGVSTAFRRSYSVLQNLSEITETEETGNHFLMMSNDTTHEENILKEPEYEPRPEVDNTEFDREHADRFRLKDRQIRMTTPNQYAHYEVNMAAMIKLGEWFDYLKENGVYDNTRIILTADHGRDMGQPDMRLEDGLDICFFNPLLLVKDFGEEEFSFSSAFMTNADTPLLAMQGLIDSPVNPFTGKVINGEEKEGEQHVFASYEFRTYVNNGSRFIPGDWYTVGNKENVMDVSSWRKISDPSR